ncbi:terpene cyclase/mutase family protein [Guptibacillus algicola]|uniref:terpene cyclase/mutase family protein n=1 Tax=Guptibacillus algicola TaxID=225844 RepID=UPI001CD6C4A2|nr:prenyltransferase/squalene oxidase repeat-containing protein [Alkalihalobacillus algicola]MCA0986467.1 squalene--hopene cyclase [Alkalihalobacillus algicola]
MRDRVESRMKDLIQLAESAQGKDGAFRYCFENSLVTNAAMIVLLRTLEVDDDELIEALVNRLLSQQDPSGYWKLYHDEVNGNLSATVQAYHSLLYSGNVSKASLKKTRDYIIKNGGLGATDSFTKVFLSIHGHLKWQNFFHFPMLFMLVPESFPISFYDLSSYARIHFAPLIIMQDKKFTIHTKWTPDLSDLVVRERNTMDDSQDSVQRLPTNLLFLARKRAEQYMLQRIESDGTLFNYATATFFMAYAMLALGYDRRSPTIMNAVEGLKKMIWVPLMHVQNSPSTIWDTALISYALDEAGVSYESSVRINSVNYLLEHQQDREGDWAITRPTIQPGGWGFSRGNTFHPDMDDTSAALRAITRYITFDEKIHSAWQNGVNWLIGMQNDDGGWPAFEPDRKALLLKDLPIDGANSSFPDDSTADLTGRTIEFLCHDAGLKGSHPVIQKAMNWLIKNQESDGSWYGRWGIYYLYGTWAALTGLKAADLSGDHPTVRNGLDFLKKTQHAAGGWGESCSSNVKQRYIPLSHSTPSQTAWAVNALMSWEGNTIEVRKGIDYLLKRSFTERELTYPTGAGLEGSFYIHYHSYNIIWPLLTLAQYYKISDEKD